MTFDKKHDGHDGDAIRQAERIVAEIKGHRHDYSVEPRDCPKCRANGVRDYRDLGPVTDDEPHGSPAWLGWFMLALLILVGFGVTVTVVLAIVHARGVQ